jgi:hypothetical protein
MKRVLLGLFVLLSCFQGIGEQKAEGEENRGREEYEKIAMLWKVGWTEILTLFSSFTLLLSSPPPTSHPLTPPPPSFSLPI